MANNHSEAPADDFLEQILGFPGYTVGGAFGSGTGFPLALSLEQGKTGFGEAIGIGKSYSREEIVGSHTSSSLKSGYHGQQMANTVTHPPVVRPRVRARRGQATDPRSIAERLRRERIGERMRALQELVPNVNKTDRAGMLDVVVDYVKFLRLQVKIGRSGCSGRTTALKNKLMEENMGAAMQFLQSKALCIMPVSLASAIYNTQPETFGLDERR